MTSAPVPGGGSAARARRSDHGAATRVGFTSVQPCRVDDVPSGGAGRSLATGIAVGGPAGATRPSSAARCTMRSGDASDRVLVPRLLVALLGRRGALIEPIDRDLTLGEERVEGDDGEHRETAADPRPMRRRRC